MESYYAELLASPATTAPTRKVLEERAAATPKAPEFFDESNYLTLVLTCQELADEKLGELIASQIDERLQHS
ncbi:hypothetical protein EON80_13170, partial [bacterium]